MKAKVRNRICRLIIVGGILLILSSSCKQEKEILYGHIADIQGNTYKTVAVGNQVWMAENLKTTEFNDGTAIPLVTDSVAWQTLTTPGYSWYNNDEAAYNHTYGALYNWFVVDLGSNGGKNLCPAGWHVPSNAEWHTLTEYLGGDTVASGKLKEAGTEHWATPNTGATNETGFTALPGGMRGGFGSFYSIGYLGSWWSSTSWNQTDCAIPRYIEYSDIWVDSDIQYKWAGMSVRCLKDN
jgi:uncharacterized protein (TIGR02145 family)